MQNLIIFLLFRLHLKSFESLFEVIGNSVPMNSYVILSKCIQLTTDSVWAGYRKVRCLEYACHVQLQTLRSAHQRSVLWKKFKRLLPTTLHHITEYKWKPIALVLIVGLQSSERPNVQLKLKVIQNSSWRCRENFHELGCFQTNFPRFSMIRAKINKIVFSVTHEIFLKFFHAAWKNPMNYGWENHEQFSMHVLQKSYHFCSDH